MRAGLSPGCCICAPFCLGLKLQNIPDRMCCGSGSPLGAPGTCPEQVTLGARAFISEGLRWALEKRLPLLPSASCWEISHLALGVVGFQSGPRSSACPQLCASPLNRNGKDGSAVFHPGEETHFWHSLSSSTSLVGILNVRSSPSGMGKAEEEMHHLSQSFQTIFGFSSLVQETRGNTQKCLVCHPQQQHTCTPLPGISHNSLNSL